MMKRENLLIAGIFLLVLVMSLASVDALGQGRIVVSKTALANKSNVSATATTINVTCNRASLGDVTNVTLYYNATAHRGAAVVTDMLNYTTNTSVNQSNGFTILTTITGLSNRDTYTFWCRAINQTGYVVNSSYYNITNITIDRTAPVVKVYKASVSTKHDNATVYKNTESVTYKVFVADTIWLTDSYKCKFNLNQSLGEANQSVTIAKVNSTHGWCNSTALTLKNTVDGVNISRIWMNDSAGNMRQNSSVYIWVDSSNPTASATCNPSSVTSGTTLTCSCSGTDSITSVNTTTADLVVTTSTKGTFTYSCTVTDQASNSASQDATYTVTSAAGSSSSSSSGGGGGTTTGTVSSSTGPHIFTKITPGVATIKQYTDPEIGVKEIEIEVNNEAQNVQITVKKYSGKPAEVEVEKTGTIYQYFEIDTTNLNEKLNKATITVKVEKSWLATNGIANEDVVVSKFDKSTGEWNELTTMFNSEDETYAYFETEVNSFSFFAISGNVVEEEEDSGGIINDLISGGEETTSNTTTWMWVIVVIVVLIIAGAYFTARKRR
ncbi:PGF-pre-PGF domain-containing protein [Candidatus Pacearchaeota archaeon]|nr:PGF-pre-PGF domain-containing protein [Candidatus Pacearchaeota archaeon]